MEIGDAQREVRSVYSGGFPGLLVSGLVWLLAAALGSWLSWSSAMWTLVIGGVFIFLALEGLTRAVGHRPALSPANPLNPLMMQLVFLLPMLLPLVVAAFLSRQDWLFPAFMIALGAHFLPFMFLFGIWQFGALGILMALCGVVFGMNGDEHYAVAGWFGALVQLLFAAIMLTEVRRENGAGRRRE